MSDDVMQHIKQAMEDQRLKAFEEGWEVGYNAAWDAFTEVVRTKAIDRKGPALNGVEEAVEIAQAAVETSAAEGPPNAVGGRRLTPAKQRAITYVTEHPGVTSSQTRGCGIGQGTLYGLVKAGMLVKEGRKFYPAQNS